MDQELKNKNEVTLIEALKEIKKSVPAQINRIIEINREWYLEYGSKNE